MLRRGLFAGLAATATAIAAGLAVYLWPRRATASEFDAGAAADFEVGEVRHFQVSGRAAAPEDARLADPRRAEARDFHLVRRPDGFVAFWHRCTHLGCTVPFRPEFEVPSVAPGQKGLFRCPCHGSTFSRDEAEVVFGPAPRPLDALPLRVHNGRVLVTVRQGAERRRARGEKVTAARTTA